MTRPGSFAGRAEGTFAESYRVDFPWLARMAVWSSTADRSARSELSRGRPDDSTKRPREMAGVLEARRQAGLEDGALRVSKGLLGAFDSSPQNILMGRAAHALLKELRKVVRAHSGDTGEFPHAQVPRQVLADVIEDPPEATPGHPSPVILGRRGSRTVATHEVHGQGILQRLAVQPAGGGIIGKIRSHGSKNCCEVGIDQSPMFDDLPPSRRRARQRGGIQEPGPPSVPQELNRGSERTRGVSGSANGAAGPLSDRTFSGIPRHSITSAKVSITS
jgi:hypothetical protein